jgi:RNA polymerase sigma-70 factor, ECF subfamily
MNEAFLMTLPATSALPRETDWSQSFRTVYESQSGNVTRFLLRLGVQRAQVEDASQEVFLEAFRYLPQFRGECSLKTWLYRICVSEARRSRKKETVRKVLLACIGQTTEPTYGTRGDLTNEQSVKLVESALKKLNHGDREAFVLFELEGLPGSEIARILEIPEATVWRRLHYARERFREHIESRTGS